MKNVLVSAAAMGLIVLVTSCELVAYKDEAGASTGVGTSSVSASGSSSSGVEPCMAGAPLGCSTTSDCYKFCLSEYPMKCGSTNAYGDPAACCTFCQTFETGLALNTVGCRRGYLTGALASNNPCSDAGPYSAKCGGATNDAITAIKSICKCPTLPPMNFSIDQFAWLVNAADSVARGCTVNAECFCDSAWNGINNQCQACPASGG